MFSEERASSCYYLLLQLPLALTRDSTVQCPSRIQLKLLAHECLGRSRIPRSQAPHVSLTLIARDGIREHQNQLRRHQKP